MWFQNEYLVSPSFKGTFTPVCFHLLWSAIALHNLHCYLICIRIYVYVRSDIFLNNCISNKCVISYRKCFFEINWNDNDQEIWTPWYLGIHLQTFQMWVLPDPQSELEWVMNPCQRTKCIFLFQIYYEVLITLTLASLWISKPRIV